MYLRDALLSKTSGGYNSELKCGSPLELLAERGQAACGWLEAITWAGKFTF